MNYLSNDNKGLLWGVLQESNLFDGIENHKFQKIKNIFENTLYTINLNYPNKSLIEKNKITIDELTQKINHEKKQVEPKIQMVYKSEDLKLERINDFNMKLKQQQDDLNVVINRNKPREINFNDNTIDDKPIGDDMDRLISEKLASRERELEIPPMAENALSWINNGRDIPEKKKVSFNEHVNIQTDTLDQPNIRLAQSREDIRPPIHNDEDISIYNSQNNIHPHPNKSVNTILNILKRKPATPGSSEIGDNYDERTQSTRDHVYVNNISTSNIATSNIATSNISTSNIADDNVDKINIILQDINQIKETQAMLLSTCTQILHYITSNKNIG